MRANKSHTANRRSHHALKMVQFSLCKDCGSPRAQHQVCQNCGKYNGRTVIDFQAKLVKKEKKKKEKEMQVK